MKSQYRCDQFGEKSRQIKLAKSQNGKTATFNKEREPSYDDIAPHISCIRSLTATA